MCQPSGTRRQRGVGLAGLLLREEDWVGWAGEPREMARVRKSIQLGTPGRGRWALLLCLAWPFSCLNPMPDDFPNHHDEESVAVSPNPEGPPSAPEPNPSTGGSGVSGPSDEEPAFEDDPADATTAPDAGAPPTADAGVEEDDVSP
jgi:hypothetical protein